MAALRARTVVGDLEQGNKTAPLGAFTAFVGTVTVNDVFETTGVFVLPVPLNTNNQPTGDGPSERNPIRTKAFFDLIEGKISF